MVELLHLPPPAEAISRMAAIDGVRMTPAVLSAQDGPDHHLGPESAGAILLLQTSFVDEAKFNAFWEKAATLFELLATAPGFIRRFAFADGVNYHLFALWRTVDDAHTFFHREEHQEAMRGLFKERWQYTHFAGLWEMNTPRQRMIFCQECDAVTPTTDRTCSGCGMELFDPFG